MVRLVEQTAGSNLYNIRRRYKDEARGFDAVLEFLANLNVLEASSEHVRPGTGFPAIYETLTTTPDIFPRCLVKLALEANIIHGREIRRYLVGFEIVGDSLVMPTLPSGDSRYVVRNALIESGIVVLDHASGDCTISPEHEEIFVLAKYCTGISPDELIDQSQRRVDIGNDAEVAVLMYERETVRADLVHRVVHVARKNSGAGFDIASVRSIDGQTARLRLIEVKAVSPRTLEFTLSSNEHRVAMENGDSYYLYLVPIRNGVPDIESLMIIQGPAVNVIENPIEWNVTADGFRCKTKVDIERE